MWLSSSSSLLQEVQASVERAQPRASGSSGMTRKRKQVRPRRVSPSASRVSESPRTASNQPQDDGEQQERPLPVAAPTNPREQLLALPGIVATRIPNEQSFERLKQYLSDNQPCDPQPVSWESIVVNFWNMIGIWWSCLCTLWSSSVEQTLTV